MLFDVRVVYYPLPGMEKLVHCDKMCEFMRRQEPLNAHHNGTAANVGHFPVLILPPLSRCKVTMEQVWILTPSLGQEGPALTSITDHPVSSPDGTNSISTI